MIRQCMDADAFSEPTTYRGVPMKSQLEAQQAARMDAHGWKWEYEPQRFYGKDDTYLPDFWVEFAPGRGCYLECKGAWPDDIAAVQKRMEIIWDTKPDAFLALLVDECEGLWGARGDGDRQWRWG